MGYMIVDSLDSLLVLGLEEEYFRARDWVRDALDFERDAEYNTFEVGSVACCLPPGAAALRPEPWR